MSVLPDKNEAEIIFLPDAGSVETIECLNRQLSQAREKIAVLRGLLQEALPYFDAKTRPTELHARIQEEAWREPDLLEF